MNSINTGMQRATELTVSKQINGTEVSGYPHIYRIGDAFLNYIYITDDELSKITVDEYTSRLAAFETYVEGIEQGVNVDITPAYRENQTSCPIQ